MINQYMEVAPSTFQVVYVVSIWQIYCTSSFELKLYVYSLAIPQTRARWNRIGFWTHDTILRKSGSSSGLYIQVTQSGKGQQDPDMTWTMKYWLVQVLGSLLHGLWNNPKMKLGRTSSQKTAFITKGPNRSLCDLFVAPICCRWLPVQFREGDLRLKQKLWRKLWREWYPPWN